MVNEDVAKIILVDREPAGMSSEEIVIYTNEYMNYCKELYKLVTEHSGVSDKEARNAIYERMLSPFQYFLEDKIRMERYRKKRGVFSHIKE